MTNFIIRRLIPFFVVTVISEGLYLLLQLINNFGVLDLRPLALVQTLGVLLLTTLVSFLFMVIPYVLYLLFLPSARVNGRVDRAVTCSLFALFVFLTLFEKAASWVFWDEFQSAFNFIAVDYLVYTHEVIANINESYPMGWILSALLLLTAVIVYAGRRFLFPAPASPHFGRRLFSTAVYALVCLLAYHNVDISRLEVTSNRYNNELAKEGTYSLFSAFLKNELPYKDFYIMHDEAQNLQILQNKLGGRGIVFAEPGQSVKRHIRSPRAEQKHNVVIVLMESMSSKFLTENRYPGQPVITPTLDRLSKEGLFFSRTYASGTRSVRGIEAVNLSIPPLPGQSIVRRPGNENLHGLGPVFAEKGYDNKWIYGGYGYFDNMNAFLGGNGFRVVDRTAWADGEITFANAWGAADEDTFAKVIKEADKSYASGKPFLTLLLTISNHRPYTYPSGKVSLTGGREGGVQYADYAIGEFLRRAESKPWFDNTIFVFVADHTAGAAGDEEIDLEGHHIPWIIYAPKLVKARRIDMPVSQLDVLPTLLGLLNFDYESRFYGQDALSPDYESRFFVSNFQKIGYVKNGAGVILKPVRDYAVLPAGTQSTHVQTLLDEAVAFYQSASHWKHFLKK